MGSVALIDKKFESVAIVKYTRWLLANRYKVLIASVLLALGFGSGARFLGFTNDYRVFFGEDNPQLLAFEEVEDTYTKADNILFVVTPRNGQVFHAQTLKELQELTKRSWQIPYSTRVDSLTNFQHTTAKGDDLFVDDLVPENVEALTEEELQKIKSIALEEPILNKRLITERSHVTGVNVSIQLPGKNPEEVMEVNTFVREMRDQFEKEYPNIDLRISGVVAMNNAFAEMGQNDAATLTPLMYLLMLIVMAFLLRSVGATFAALGVIILTTMSAMGLAGYMGILLTPPSAIAPTVILTLAIADSVHILMTMIMMMRRGWEKTEAIVESLRVNFQAVFLTSITTMVGFFSLNFSDSPPYHDLGNITAIGVFFAFAFSVTFLPVVVDLLPIKISQRAQKQTVIFEKFGNFVVRRHQILMWGSLGVFIFLSAMTPRIDLNDEFVKWFDERVEFRRDTDYMMGNLTGIYDLQYSISAGEAEGISDPQFMSRVENFANWWRDQPEVIHVGTYTDIMKKINKTMHSDEESWYKLPDDLELASQYLLLYEMSLPFGLDLNNQIDIDKSKIKMTVTTKELTTQEARELAHRGDTWLSENAPPKMHASATSPMVMFSHISDRNIQSMVKGTIFAIILITILMMLSLKSIKYGLISFLPNTIPVLLTFGFWALIVQQVGMAISIVASATLGIIVDDSVHFLTKFLRAKREHGLTTEKSVQYAFSNVGMALTVTSLILVIGFGILTYSPFQLNWSLGLLSAITILFALAVDFLFLPSFLIYLDSKGKKQTTT